MKIQGQNSGKYIADTFKTLPLLRCYMQAARLDAYWLAIAAKQHLFYHDQITTTCPTIHNNLP
jgi:hypothetical protein